MSKRFLKPKANAQKSKNRKTKPLWKKWKTRKKQ